MEMKLLAYSPDKLLQLWQVGEAKNERLGPPVLVWDVQKKELIEGEEEPPPLQVMLKFNPYWEFLETPMPMPTPNKDEEQADFLKRCIPAEIKAGMEPDQATAVCYQQWRDAKKVKESK